MPTSNWRLPKEEVRGGALSAAVTMQVRTWMGRDNRYFIVHYWGTVDALIASGCLTPHMMANRNARRRGGRAQRDEHGRRFTLNRLPTKAAPDRMKLMRRSEDPALAMELPGVRELFSEGIPEPPAQVEPQSKEERLRFVGKALSFVQDATTWLGDRDQVLLSDIDLECAGLLVDRFLAEIHALMKQAGALETQQPSTRPPFLRLVVNNSA
jgi:hypothetical protein